MHVVEFEADAKNGIIKIPKKYKDLYSKHLKLVVTWTEESIKPSKKTDKSSLRGALKNYANPDSIKKEKDAWATAAKEKHEPYRR